MSETDKFKAELEQDWKSLEKRARSQIVEIAEYVFSIIQDIAPVDTGRFRANWNAAVAIPDPHTTQESDKTSDKTLRRAKVKIREYKHFGNWPPIYISNALPYALKLENGHSSQAPIGVVSVAVANANYKFSGVDI